MRHFNFLVHKLYQKNEITYLSEKLRNHACQKCGTHQLAQRKGLKNLGLKQLFYATMQASRRHPDISFSSCHRLFLRFARLFLQCVLGTRVEVVVVITWLYSLRSFCETIATVCLEYQGSRGNRDHVTFYFA